MDPGPFDPPPLSAKKEYFQSIAMYSPLNMSLVVRNLSSVRLACSDTNRSAQLQKIE